MRNSSASDPKGLYTTKKRACVQALKIETQIDNSDIKTNPVSAEAKKFIGKTIVCRQLIYQVYWKSRVTK